MFVPCLAWGQQQGWNCSTQQGLHCCVTHPSQGEPFPRQVSSEAEHPANDTKQSNALLSELEGSRQHQSSGRPLFLLQAHGGSAR